MASTYSPSLKLELIGNGDQSGVWGTTTNNNLGTLLEQAITGVQTITMANANYILTNYNGVSDEARNAVLVVQGTNSAVRQVVCPLVNKLYIVSNQTSGGYDITIGGTTGGAVTIPSGTTAQVYCDGTNFFSSQTGSAGNFDINGNLNVDGITTLVGATTMTGALSGTTATFSGAISSVSPNFTGIPTAPTAAAGTSSTQIATTAFVVANSVVAGSIQMWPTASAPAGYLLCDGSAVSRTTYSVLFAVIGTTFGAGDTTTTFNLPNYVNRMPIGVGSTAALAATGGSKDAVVVSHTHTTSITDPGHTHSPGVSFANTNAGSATGISQSSFSGIYQSNINTGFTNISVTNNTTGVSGTDANLPPYLGINFIIKT